MLQVDDDSTSVLMKHMYQHLMDGRTTVAQALRLAMLHLLRRPVTGPSPHWRRPVFWAGFLVVGATTRLRCPPQVMLRGWKHDCLLLALPHSLARSPRRSLFPALSFYLSLSLCVCVCACVCAFLKRIVISARQSVSCRAC